MALVGITRCISGTSRPRRNSPDCAKDEYATDKSFVWRARGARLFFKSCCGADQDRRRRGIDRQCRAVWRADPQRVRVGDERDQRQRRYQRSEDRAGGRRRAGQKRRSDQRFQEANLSGQGVDAVRADAVQFGAGFRSGGPGRQGGGLRHVEYRRRYYLDRQLCFSQFGHRGRYLAGDLEGRGAENRPKKSRGALRQRRYFYQERL